MAMKWLRLSDDVLDDPKVQKLPPFLFKVWVNLLCLANKGEQRGLLPDMETIAFRLRISEEDAGIAISELTKRGLLDSHEEGITPHNWQGWQSTPDYPSWSPEANRDRVRKHREGKKLVTEQETEPHVTSETSHVTSETNVTTIERDKREIRERIDGEGGVTHTHTSPAETASPLPPPPILEISAEEEARQVFGFTPNFERPIPQPVHPDPVSPYPDRLYREGAKRGYSVLEIREAGRIAAEERQKNPKEGGFWAYAATLLPTARENLANKPPPIVPVDPQEARRLKAEQEAKARAEQAEQLARVERDLEIFNRKREERNRNEQAVTTP